MCPWKSSSPDAATQVWDSSRESQTPGGDVTRGSLSNGPSAGYELHEYRDNRKHQQQVDETTQGVRADDSQQPQQQQHDEECPQHGHSHIGRTLTREVN